MRNKARAFRSNRMNFQKAMMLGLSLGLVLAAGAAFAEEEDKERFELEGYATINYYHFNWQTDPARRDAVDLERLAIESEYHVSPRIFVKTELEFEHGGTGSTLEYDYLEEGGEIETEVEKGGEIRLEQLYLAFLLHPAFNIKLGHMLVPVGFAPKLDEPIDYFTVERSEAERAMVPVLWDETGAEIFGDVLGMRYQLQVVNGLDNTFFSAGNWIAFGHQGRFETVNAENWALAGRLESERIPSTLLGLSGYFGNSRDNRIKDDLGPNAYVSILSGHGQWVRGPFTVRALGMWGNLGNSEAVTNANKSNRNQLGSKKTPIGAQAYASFVEAGVDVLRLALPDTRGQSGVFFVRFDSYDTQYKTQGTVYDNPRWDRQVYTTGVNYKPHPQVILKSQYARRENGLGQRDKTFSCGVGVVMF